MINLSNPLKANQWNLIDVNDLYKFHLNYKHD
jgi:hypothetical protein